MTQFDVFNRLKIYKSSTEIKCLFRTKKTSLLLIKLHLYVYARRFHTIDIKKILNTGLKYEQLAALASAPGKPLADTVNEDGDAKVLIDCGLLRYAYSFCRAY